jgi:hypothetical protein
MLTRWNAKNCFKRKYEITLQYFYPKINYCALLHRNFLGQLSWSILTLVHVSLCRRTPALLMVHGLHARCLLSFYYSRSVKSTDSMHWPSVDTVFASFQIAAHSSLLCLQLKHQLHHHDVPQAKRNRTSSKEFTELSVPKGEYFSVGGELQ